MSWCHKENCGRQISGRHQQQHSYKGGVQLQEVTVPANCLTYNQIIKILFPKICAIMHPIPPFAALATPAAAASASPTSLTPLVPRKPALLSIYSNESCNNLEAYISIPLAYNDTCLVLLGDGFKCNLYDQVGFSGILTSLFSSCLMIANTWAVRTYMDSSCQYDQCHDSREFNSFQIHSVWDTEPDVYFLRGRLLIKNERDGEIFGGFVWMNWILTENWKTII
jgi:hypothetical protein